MTAQTIILAAIVLAFSTLGVTLFVVAWWSSLEPAAKRGTQPAVAAARRPATAVSLDKV